MDKVDLTSLPEFPQQFLYQKVEDRYSVHGPASIGMHSPERTRSFLARLDKKYPKRFADASWGNDAADNVLSPSDNVAIFIPNALKTNYEEEEFAMWTIDLSPDDVSRTLEFSSEEEVMAELEKRLNK